MGCIEKFLEPKNGVMFMRSEDGTESFVELHVVFPGVVFSVEPFVEPHVILLHVVFSVVLFSIGVFDFQFVMLNAANEVCIDAIKSRTPTNRDAALIPLYLLIF